MGACSTAGTPVVFVFTDTGGTFTGIGSTNSSGDSFAVHTGTGIPSCTGWIAGTSSTSGPVSGASSNSACGVPGPVLGGSTPALALAMGGFLIWRVRRRNEAV
jgi:hypothetical protein